MTQLDSFASLHPSLSCSHLTPLCCNASTSFFACVLLPLRSTPSNRMKAPRAPWAAMVVLLLLVLTNVFLIDLNERLTSLCGLYALSM